ncbi:MAG: hypothetical protein GX589_11070 [Deltaproteobacteria bacterium]|nr:hypothetical protein [Deltaproteobacteria bacterium]
MDQRGLIGAQRFDWAKICRVGGGIWFLVFGIFTFSGESKLRARLRGGALGVVALSDTAGARHAAALG